MTKKETERLKQVIFNIIEDNLETRWFGLDFYDGTRYRLKISQGKTYRHIDKYPNYLLIKFDLDKIDFRHVKKASLFAEHFFQDKTTKENKRKIYKF